VYLQVRPHAGGLSDLYLHLSRGHPVKVIKAVAVGLALIGVMALLTAGVFAVFGKTVNVTMTKVP
jgi:hypothetical protein